MINFRPNCTFPTTAPSGFVKSPNIRSTMDVFWTCASISILSTWSVLPLTVPPDIKTRSRLQWIRKKVYLLGRKLSWMGIMLAFPEYVVGIATTNLFAACVNTPQLRELAGVDDVPWSLTHTILANMGGIAIRFSEPSQREDSQRQFQQPSKSTDLKSPKEPIGVVERCDQGQQPMDRVSATQPAMEAVNSRVSQDAETGTDSISKIPSKSEDVPRFLQDFRRSQNRHLSRLGEIPWAPFGPHLALAVNAQTATHNWPTQNIDTAALHGNIWILDSKQLALARSYGLIPKLPSITKEEIEDKSKSDGLVRLLAVMQILWLAVQLIIRRIANVPFAALEISTVAFSSCAFIIYVMEWSKPKDVGVPIYLETDAVVSPAIFLRIAEAAPAVFLQARHYYVPNSCTHQVIQGKFGKKHVELVMIVSTVLSIALFGGIHLFAWNTHFSTYVEKLLWRSAALTVAVAPTISALIVFLESVVGHRTVKISTLSVLILAPIYLAARSFILVESVRSLYFLPPKAFTSTWAMNAPHAG